MINKHQLTLTVTLFSEKDTANLGALIGPTTARAVEDCLHRNSLNRYLYQEVSYSLESKND
jgi:hypothetical protein